MILAMIAVLAIVGAAYCILARWFRGAFVATSEMALAAIPLGGAAVAALATLGMTVFPTAIAGIAALGVVTCAGIIAGFSLWRRGGAFRIAFPTEERRVGATALATASVVALVLGALIAQSLALGGDSSYTVGPGATGDVFYHLSQVTRIAYTTNWDFEEPNFAGEFIGYPFFVNLLSALLLNMGAPLVFAFHAPTLLLGAAGIFLFAVLLRRSGASPYVTVIALMGTFFGSGLGYVAYASGMPELGLLMRHTVPYPMQAIAYPAFIPTFLAVQRAFVFGLALFLIALLGIIRGIGRENRTAFLVAGVAIGLLPQSHTHSFIAIIIVAAIGLVYCILWRDGLMFDYVRWTLFPAFFLALPQVAAFAFLPRYNSVPLLTFRLGWLSDPREVLAVRLRAPGAARFFPWLRFMGTNFGAMLLLPVSVALRIRYFAAHPALAVLGGGALALWIVPNLIQFHAWDVNMNKIFGYAILLSFAASALAIETLGGFRRAVGLALFAAITAASIPSAVITITHFLATPSAAAFRIHGADAAAAAAWIRGHTPEDASFVSSGFLPRRDLIQSEAVVFSGRKSPLGPVVWVYTHGIDPTERLEIIDAFLKEPKRDPASSSRLHAEYLLIDDALRAAYPGLDERIERAGFPVLFRAGELRVIGLE